MPITLSGNRSFRKRNRNRLSGRHGRLKRHISITGRTISPVPDISRYGSEGCFGRARTLSLPWLPISSGAGQRLRSAAGVTSRWRPPKPPKGRVWGRPTRRLHQVPPERLRQLRTTPGGVDSPPPPAFRTSGFRRGPSSRRGRRSPSSPAGHLGIGHGPQAALLDHARAARRVGACAGSWDARALVGDLAAGLAADRVYESVDELAWAMQAQLATLAGSPAFPVWSRPDPTFKPRLSGFLATPQGTRRVTVLLDTGATHCFICARLAATLGLPPSAHPGPTSVTTAAPGGTQDLPAPVMAHLGLGDTFREPARGALGLTDGYGRRRPDPGLGLDLEPRSAPPLR